MLLFRAVTLTVLGNQGIGPFPDDVRTLSNGFIPGFLGNVGLGPLGGADLFTLLVGLAAVAASRSSQWRARTRPAGLRPGRRPVPAVRRSRSRAPARGADGRHRAAGPVPQPAVGAGAARRPGPRLHAADQPRGLRPPHLRRRRQPAGGDAVRRQGQVGHLLDLRQHGRARRASPGSSSPAGSTRRARPRATPSSSTPSRRRSSAARPCRAASARSSARSPAA